MDIKSLAYAVVFAALAWCFTELLKADQQRRVVGCANDAELASAAALVLLVSFFVLLCLVFH